MSALEGILRKRKLGFYLKRALLALSGIIFMFTLLICYPQAYYFSDKVNYKNFQVYYDKKIPKEIYPILDTVDQLIQKSDCYDLILLRVSRQKQPRFSGFVFCFSEFYDVSHDKTNFKFSMRPSYLDKS